MSERDPFPELRGWRVALSTVLLQVPHVWRVSVAEWAHPHVFARAAFGREYVLTVYLPAGDVTPGAEFVTSELKDTHAAIRAAVDDLLTRAVAAGNLSAARGLARRRAST